MPSTSAVTAPLVAGFTILPGLQVSPYGSQITTLKTYDFTLIETGKLSSTGLGSTNEGAYTVNGLSTSDLPFSLIPSTGPYGFGGLSAGESGIAVGSLRVSAANTLKVAWVRTGTSTAAVTSSTGQLSTLFTISYAAQASSTTT